jgi:hypothetical protein
VNDAVSEAFYVRWATGYEWVHQLPPEAFEQLQQLLQDHELPQPALGDPPGIVRHRRAGATFVSFVGACLDANGRPVRHYHVVLIRGRAASTADAVVAALRNQYADRAALDRLAGALTAVRPDDAGPLLAGLSVADAVASEPSARRPRTSTPRDAPTVLVDVPSQAPVVDAPRPQRRVGRLVLFAGTIGLAALSATFGAQLADSDGDGHWTRLLGGSDCNDGDAEIHPDATEHLDGVDQDCDGRELCHPDGDHDGHGATAAIAGAYGDLTCTNPGWARTGDDCDDADAARHPGLDEVAGNGVDDDCSGSDDCFVDRDEDGFGDDDTPMVPTTTGCEDSGTAVRAGDCDDRDGGVHPGAGGYGRGRDVDCVEGLQPHEQACTQGDGAPTEFWTDHDGDGRRDCLQETYAGALDASAEVSGYVVLLQAARPAPCAQVRVRWRHPGERWSDRRTTTFAAEEPLRCAVGGTGRRCGGSPTPGRDVAYEWQCAVQAFEAATPNEVRWVVAARGETRGLASSEPTGSAPLGQD